MNGPADPKLERCRLDFIAGLGAGSQRHVTAILPALYGDAPYEGVFSDDPGGQRLQNLAMRQYVDAASFLDPQATLPLVYHWMSRPTSADPHLRRTRYMSCGSALRKAGRFEESVRLLEQARAESSAPAQIRATEVLLSITLRRAGRLEEALEIAARVAAARRREYVDLHNAAVLEADEQLAATQLGLGIYDLAEAVAFRDRCIDRSGLMSGITMRAFHRVGLCWLRQGELGAAFGSALTILQIRDDEEYGPAVSSDMDLFSAEVSEAIAATGTCRDPERWLAHAGAARANAHRSMAFAYGADHPVVRSMEI